MRIVTLGRVAGIGEGDDHLYEGNGYLLRFGIQSPDQFFLTQLPSIVDALNSRNHFDVRQIIRLELMRAGYSGLRHVMIYLSFKDLPKAKRPENAISKLSTEPSILPSDPYMLDHDVVRERLIQFFLLAPKTVKAQFLKDSVRTLEHKHTEFGSGVQKSSVAAGFLYRVSFDAGSPPGIAEWRNTLLYCSEILRNDFSPTLFERVTFTAIPNSEQDYRVEAELSLQVKPRVYQPRSELRFSPRRASTSRSFKVVEFQTGRLEHKLLKEPEKRAVDRFDELDTEARLCLWTQHLSKFFKRLHPSVSGPLQWPNSPV